MGTEEGEHGPLTVRRFDANGDGRWEWLVQVTTMLPTDHSGACELEPGSCEAALISSAGVEELGCDPRYFELEDGSRGLLWAEERDDLRYAESPRHRVAFDRGGPLDLLVLTPSPSSRVEAFEALFERRDDAQDWRDSMYDRLVTEPAAVHTELGL